MRVSRLNLFLALLLSKMSLFSAALTAESTVSIRTTDFAPSPDALFSIAGKAEMAVYRAFREKYPNIRPEGNSLSLKLEGPAGEAPLLMSIAGRTAPDVMHVNTRQSGSYIGRNFLLPLDEYINSEQTAAEAKELGEYDENIMYREELEERVLSLIHI